MFRFTKTVTRALTTATVLGAIALAGPVALAADATDAAAPAVVATPAAAPTAKAARIDHIDQRIVSLHDKLRITPAQEAQWTVVAQAMRDNAKTMDGLIKERAAGAKTMTAIDDLVSYEKLAAAHEAGLKAFIPVFQTLYDALASDQKKSADAVFRDHGPHAGHGPHVKH